MSALAVVVPCDTTKDQGWLKVYGLQACDAERLDAYVAGLAADASFTKINFVRDSHQKIKSILIPLKSISQKDIVDHILARFVACVGHGVKKLEGLQ